MYASLICFDIIIILRAALSVIRARKKFLLGLILNICHDEVGIKHVKIKSDKYIFSCFVFISHIRTKLLFVF